MLIRLLLAAEKTTLEGRIRRILPRDGVIFECIRDRRDLWAQIAAESADLVLVSRTLIPEPAADSVRQLRQSPESTAVVVLSPGDDGKDRAHLLAAGCEAVIDLRWGDEVLRPLLLEVLLRRKDRVAGRLDHKDPLDEQRLSDFATSSPAMQAFMAVVGRVADSDTTLLVEGETGVGKERLARAIHAESRRRAGPLVAVNCGAIPESLLESELFGHEEGAFTGATRARRGCFELAHGGTVLLDEVGDVPLHLQVKLLRVLQEREIRPLGGEKALRVDVRVIAATNRDLARAAECGEFRLDLYYRLGVVTLNIPPLRERREDIPDLAQSYVEYYRGVMGRPIEGIDGSAVESLVEYDWPGNVRELMNVVERAVLLATGPRITREDLPESIGGRVLAAPLTAAGEDTSATATVPGHWLDRPWSEVRERALLQVESAYLRALLEATAGRVGETAARAGMTARSLYEKMRRHGLRKEDFRA